ncbi:MAG TPA: response regulator [Gaiellaceae bacterium]|jgi:CheY-like chemotaxis protein|nr:response regulator [Gaiellaceae bacterium]
MPSRDLPADAPTTGIRLLVADDDSRIRSLFAALLGEAAGVASVIEAGDGIEAVQLGRHYRPEAAVLDLKMPRLDGVAAALALRALQPAMQIALHSSDPDALRVRASGLGLPLFDKLEFEHLVAWVERHAAHSARDRETITGGAALAQKSELICSLCGYGIVSCKTPDRCPMCGGSAWADPPVRMRRASAY